MSEMYRKLERNWKWDVQLSTISSDGPLHVLSDATPRGRGTKNRWKEF